MNFKLLTTTFRNLAADAVKTCQDKDILRVQAMGMLLICKLFNCTDTDTVAVSNQMAKNTNDPALQAWAFRCIIGESFTLQ